MKAQADVISAVVIIIIAIGLVSAAYMWGIPLIRKRQDTALAERAEKAFDRNNFNSLVRKIEYIYKNGGEDTFTLDIDGVWTLYPCPSTDGGGCTCDSTSPCNSINNSIQFTFFSKVSNIAIGQDWVPLSSPNTDPIGIVGVDDSSVVFARADEYGDGFNIAYKIWFRELDEITTPRGHKIDLVDPNPGTPIVKSSTGKSLRISRGPIQQVQNLIITEIKLYLV